MLLLQQLMDSFRGLPLLRSSSRVGPVDPSFRALFGRLQSTVRRHKFNNDSFSGSTTGGAVCFVSDGIFWETQRFADVPGTNFWTRRY